MASVELALPKEPLSIIASTRSYIFKMVKGTRIRGFKAFILDPFTTQCVSSVTSMTEMLQTNGMNAYNIHVVMLHSTFNQRSKIMTSPLKCPLLLILSLAVFLVELLSTTTQRQGSMSHLSAVIFIRPTPANVAMLAQILRKPKFQEYHIFFSNIVTDPAMLQTLADADNDGRVRQVQEHYCDVIPIDPALFSLNSQRLVGAAVGRQAAAILSTFLSLNHRPAAIRFTASSPATRALAVEVARRVQADSIFNLPATSSSPVLLILDRKSDPVTPLLSQWTYQAMAHELLGLNNGRVVISELPNGEVTLSGSEDAFFEANKYQNFGDLGAAIRDLIQRFAKEHKVRTDVKSIADMQTFMEHYPAFRSQSGHLSKHVSITSELSKLVETCQLFDISALEQDLACQQDHKRQLQEVNDMFDRKEVSPVDKLRLGLLYALRYETQADIPRLKERMIENGVPPSQTKLLDKIVRYAGQANRPTGLYGERTGFFGRIKKNIAVGLAGVENVYTQHVPLLTKVLESLLKTGLNEMHYPILEPEQYKGDAGSTNARPPVNVIVWILGGATYEESTHVANLNKSMPGVSVILGGSCVHNSSSFLRELAAAQI